MMQPSNTDSNDAIGWLALIIALVALILAWVSFVRTGDNLDERINKQVQELQMTVERPKAATSAN